MSVQCKWKLSRSQAKRDIRAIAKQVQLERRLTHWTPGLRADTCAAYRLKEHVWMRRKS